MDSYSQLNSRAQRIGYNITKVVFRGYEASRSLQATHDEAVHIRTNLRLKTESEEQEQVLQEFKLKREKERTKLSECGLGCTCIVQGKKCVVGPMHLGVRGVFWGIYIILYRDVYTLSLWGLEGMCFGYLRSNMHVRVN